MPTSQITSTGDLLIKHVRETLGLALFNAAQERRFSTNGNNLVYTLLNDATIAGAPMEGVEDLAKGANIALFYLSLPAASNTPKDFYLLRIKVTELEAKAEFLSSEGVAVGNTTVVIADAAKPASEEGFKITGASLIGNCISVSGTYTTASGATISVTATYCFTS